VYHPLPRPVTFPARPQQTRLVASEPLTRVADVARSTLPHSTSLFFETATHLATFYNTGTDIFRLSTFVRDYFHSALAVADPSSPSSSSLLPPAPQQQHQNTDPAFLSFVWNTLLRQDDVHVGVLSRIGVEGSGDEGNKESEQGQVEPAAATEDVKGKGKAKVKTAKTGAKDQPATHSLRLLDNDEKAIPREELLEKYGENLRIAAGEQTAWTAITGSPMRVSRGIR
jgi:hypothetical protein